MTLRLYIQDVDPEVTDKDLLAVYMLYPRKGPGKKDGLAVLKKTVKTRADHANCLMAVQAFAASVAGQEAKYVRHFDRWARSWTDWLEVVQLMNRAQEDSLSSPLRVKATPPHPLETIRSYQGEPKEVVAEWVKGLGKKESGE